ncbi:hypothetical protein FOXB_15553, partial [Fusarium oxysporum f. sp. conglutinans Fo5176]
MASAQNTAAWLPGVGKPLEVRPADIPAPGEGELLIERLGNLFSPPLLGPYYLATVALDWRLTLLVLQVKAVAVQPAEYKIQDGVLPFPLRYPTIVG